MLYVPSLYFNYFLFKILPYIIIIIIYYKI